MNYNGLIIIIKRSGNIQTEYLVNKKTSVSYTINWLDDCHYTLKPNNDLFKAYPNAPQNALISVSIINTTTHSYTQSTTSNFTKTRITGEVIKID